MFDTAGMWYDRDGKELTQDEYGLLKYGTPEYRRVGLTKVQDLANPAREYEVSTVWLGLNHAHFGGPPVIFESMVFTTDQTDEMDGECVRYCTEAEAEQGHKLIVEMLTHFMKDSLVLELPEIALDADHEVSFGETSSGPAPNALPPNSSANDSVNTPPSGSPASDPAPE